MASALMSPPFTATTAKVVRNAVTLLIWLFFYSALNNIKSHYALVPYAVRYQVPIPIHGVVYIIEI